MNIPYGYCHCGCGEKTMIANMNNTARGYVKGEPRPYRPGHKKRSSRPDYLLDPETGCWNWQKNKWSRDRDYGQATLSDGSKRQAHRVYYERHKGSIPEGLVLDHLCRNPSCVNPDHLEPVTFAENVRRGNATRLNWDIVRDIRTSSLNGRELEKKYGISSACVSQIRSGKRWAEPTAESSCSASSRDDDQQAAA